MTTLRDRQAKEIDLPQFITLLHDPDYVSVARSTVGRIGVVSTIWTGVDHGDGLIFETMVFPQHPAMLDLQWRYATEEEARHGHYRARAYLGVYLGHELPLPTEER